MKNITSISATLGAALLLAGVPALVRADDTQAGPIQVASAQFLAQDISADGTGSGVPSSVKVAFTNTSDQPATSVVFALLSDGNVIDTVEDVGSFAKGVTINHYLADQPVTEAQDVAVESVTFADGSVWINPAVPSAAASSAAAAPSAMENPENASDNGTVAPIAPGADNGTGSY